MKEMTKIIVSSVKIASAERRSPHWNGYSMPSIESTSTVSMMPKTKKNRPKISSEKDAVQCGSA